MIKENIGVTPVAIRPANVTLWKQLGFKILLVMMASVSAVAVSSALKPPSVKAQNVAGGAVESANYLITPHVAR